VTGASGAATARFNSHVEVRAGRNTQAGIAFGVFVKDIHMLAIGGSLLRACSPTRNVTDTKQKNVCHTHAVSSAGYRGARQATSAWSYQHRDGDNMYRVPALRNVMIGGWQGHQTARVRALPSSCSVAV
jgi:hypothetical protein